MTLFTLIASAIEPVTRLIDSLHTSEEEKQQIKAKVFEAQSQLYTATLEHEKKLIEAQSKVINAEAQGHSWLQRNWRPLTMLFFLYLLGSYWHGYAPEYLVENPQLVDQLFNLLQIGIGGYIASRGLEKVAPKMGEVFNRK
jgi:hypothetical protein